MNLKVEHIIAIFAIGVVGLLLEQLLLLDRPSPQLRQCPEELAPRTHRRAVETAYLEHPG